MRRVEPKSISGEELARICASTRAEETLLKVGCGASMITLPLALACLLISAGGVLRLLPLGLILGLAAIFWLRHLICLPKRRYREELAYRCGGGDFSRHVKEAEAVLDQGDSSWMVLFSATGLPHGDHRWLRLELAEGQPPSARADLALSRSNPTLFKRIERVLPIDTARQLLAMAGEWRPETLTDIDAFVYDGVPCRLVVLRREPRDVTTAHCNIMGLSPELSQHPTAIACTKLYDLTQVLVGMEG